MALTIFTVSCATTENYNAIVKSWLGQPEVDLVRAWGAPQNTHQSGDTKFMVYDKRRNVQVGQTTATTNTSYSNNPYSIYDSTSTTTVNPATNINMVCITTFEIFNNRVVNVSYKGNDCRA